MTNTNFDLKIRLSDSVKKHSQVHSNISRKELIQAVIDNREAIVSESGALATWTSPESTGRSPKDTVFVKRADSEKNIDWSSPNSIPISEDTFDMIFNEGLAKLSAKEKVYITDRVIGADSKYSLPVKVVTNCSLTALFTDNMFRPIPADISRSVFFNKDFYLLVLPFDKLDSAKYEGRLRRIAEGKTSDLVIAVDFDRSVGVVIGSAYMGSVKKMMFTVMNYYLPPLGILPLHCSANEGTDGSSALLLGLSGTGKTTLSADPERALLGDDEHGWSEDGIANFENGCYAKMIDINPAKEPDIYDAVMHKDNYLNHGTIVENAMVYPNGKFDFSDRRLIENSRASFLLTYLKNIKPSSVSNHPRTILFLTADAYGVLPPVSKLDTDQAMLWFLMGYTSKLAGTETGVTEPQATFSRFFGQPFMPCNPDVYASMLGEKIRKHNSQVYLVNTGWSGGGYGVGKRIDIPLTRAMVIAALTGALAKVEYKKDELFHVYIPLSCPGVPPEILFPVNTWKDKNAYMDAARKLAKLFSEAFDKNYGNKNIAENVKLQCPGK